MIDCMIRIDRLFGGCNEVWKRVVGVFEAHAPVGNIDGVLVEVGVADMSSGVEETEFRLISAEEE